MKLVIAVNHTAPFHTGGSEKVVQQIAESMVRDYGMECHILGLYVDRTINLNGVQISRIADRSENFIGQINGLRPDHFLVYSDSFVYWPTVVRHAEEIKAAKSVALVGMNYMRAHLDLSRIFKHNHEQFRTITHSDNYLDYKSCQVMNIPVNVIPNAVDLTEFCDQGFSFREKYKIKTEKIVLCISNFFPGKGQEYLHHILKMMQKERQDFTAIFISSTVNFQPANALRLRHSQSMPKGGYPYKLLHDISRSDTIQAFREATVFAFPSQIEVAPLVILEAMSVGLPWVALDVGNIETLSGGRVIKGQKKIQGKWQYLSETYSAFTNNLICILDDISLRNNLGKEGRDRILKDFNWSQIKKQYYKLFTE